MNEPVDVDGLTPAWVSAVLRLDVRSVRVQAIGTGQTAASYRLELDAAEGPETLVAKVAVGDEKSRKRVALGARREVAFYTELAGTLGVHTPRCSYAAISEDGLRFTLLLEDLLPRVPGVQVEGCSTIRAAAAIRNVAGLHAPRWNDASLSDLPYLYRPSAEVAAFLGRYTASATETFVKRYGERLDVADRETLHASAAAIERWFLSRLEPFSLLHGDYRLDNLMFGAEPDDVVAIDWQTLDVGPPARDLAYFLSTSFVVEQRRAVEDDLVAVYHASLLERGVDGYSLQDCRLDYRLGQLQGAMITTIGAANARGERSAGTDAMFLAMARRVCAAIRDLGTLDLIRP